MALEEGDIVLCTVDRIVGTVVFVKIHHENSDAEGSIITSEIAPGRIRNLRDYVIPGKKIVCKVLRVKGKNIELSLRRVTPKERKKLSDRFKQEKSCKSILKTVLGDKADKAIENICERKDLIEFLEEVKSNPKELEEFVDKKSAEKIISILKTEKKKITKIKKEISLKTKKGNGLTLIKELLKDIQGVDIKYLASGKYSLEIATSNPKEADNKLQKIIEEIEKQAKKIGVEFHAKEK